MPPRSRKPRRSTVLGALALVAFVVGVIVLSQAKDDDELSTVDRAPLRLLDDGAGQRHFEVSYPKDRPRATMILIHGNGWVSQPQATFAATQDTVRQLTDRGFRVVAISTDQSPGLGKPNVRADGKRVLDDVLAFHDQVRDAFPDDPVCAFGASGGGHLALMLAVERPELDCVSAAAPPTDLVELVEEADLGRNHEQACAGEDELPSGAGGTVSFAACLAVQTWGSSEAALRRASPALRWPADGPPVWSAFVDGDPLIPDSQRQALAEATDGEMEVLEVSARGPAFVHAPVDAADLRRIAQSWTRWLDRVVPVAEGRAELPDGDLKEGVHTACNSRLSPGPPFGTARRRDRAELLSGAGRWRPSTPSVLVAATSSCDGAEDEQESGLSLWVPAFSQGRFIERGTSAAWVFEAPEGSTAESVTASFRGFIANPGVWRLGLYARGSASEGWSPVAECDGRRCGGLEARPGAVGGVTIVPRGTGSNPDSRAKLPEQRFELPGRPTELKWELQCIAPRGCLPRSINPGGDPTARPRRSIDPSGRPAVFSLYELQVATIER